MTKAPALGLPNPERPSQLYITGRQGVTLGGLTQDLGPAKQPVGYFSKTLDMVIQGWLHCLRVIAAAALLTEEVSKITLGQNIALYTSHQINSLLEQKGSHWLTDSGILMYQVLLLENPQVKIRHYSKPSYFNASPRGKWSPPLLY